MKKYVLTTAVAAALAMVASPVAAQDKKWFAGPTVGSTWTHGTALGFDGGYQVNKYLAVETAYDRVFNTASPIDLWSANMVAGYPIDRTKVKPYALAGLGYQWQWNANQGVWSVGGGVKVELAKGVDLDARYRYVQGLWNQNNQNVVSIGTIFKF